MIAPLDPPLHAPPRIISVDPGSTQSGYAVFDPVCSDPVVAAGILTNEALLGHLRQKALDPIGVDDDCVPLTGPHVLVVEMMRARGMPFSNDEMRTLVWLGRFIEAWGGEWAEVYRQDVKIHLCGHAKAKDTNIRAALIDRFGGKEKAIGRKAAPGPLYGVKADAWSALAVAVTYSAAPRVEVVVRQAKEEA